MRHDGRMATDPNEAAFNDQFCARVKRLREEKSWTAEEMAIALGIPPDRYRKYEVRSPMPQYLIPRFARIVDRDVEFVLTGRPNKTREPHIRPVAAPKTIEKTDAPAVKSTRSRA